MDFFGSIAAKGIGGRHELLVKNEPIPHKEKRTHLTEACEPLFTAPKISTREELSALLEKMRTRYAPFMENRAPRFEPISEHIRLTDFTLDGERITLPHYGGPLRLCDEDL